ncbi:hypothetical protein DPMN_184334 [Dreissena polymorpha]|uniref:Uncharacterized protein n=1 Tax=Dreissena polymorpha TaxID=45954 RepID=A0A9D4DIB6_DREPO|nr:hypothetical protein DPMN_184334 [Dreissena polymorpha]
MPQSRGSCGHIRAAWDNHGSCLSCAGCTQDNCCPFCEHWSADTWAIKRRTFKSRRRNMHSSDQSREVPFVGTFHHTILTICHQEMPSIGSCPLTTPDKICPVRSSGTTS